MPTRPFILLDRVSLVASSRGTLRFDVGATQTFRAKRMWFNSTSTFYIEYIKDQGGSEYTNASTGEPLLSIALQKPQTAGGGVGVFEPPLEIVAKGYLEMGLLDSSGSTNVVTIQLEGELETTA